MYPFWLIIVHWSDDLWSAVLSEFVFVSSTSTVPQPSQPTTFSDKPTDGSGMIIASEVGGIAVIVVGGCNFLLCRYKKVRLPSTLRLLI